MSTELFQSLAISLLLGGLVGLQRQHVDSPLGGVRTFPLVTMFGSLCVILTEPLGGWVVAAGLLATVVVIALGSRQVRSEADRGITSEAAMLVNSEERSVSSDLHEIQQETQECVATWNFGRKFVVRF